MYFSRKHARKVLLRFVLHYNYSFQSFLSRNVFGSMSDTSLGTRNKSKVDGVDHLEAGSQLKFTSHDMSVIAEQSVLDFDMQPLVATPLESGTGMDFSRIVSLFVNSQLISTPDL